MLNTSETPLITGMLLLWIKQVAYMGLVGSFPFNSFLSGVLSCIGTAVLAGRIFLPFVPLLPWLHDTSLLSHSLFAFHSVCLRIQVNKDNKEFKVSLVSSSNARIHSTLKIWHDDICQNFSCRIFPQKGPLLTSSCAIWCSTW
jgi:hypothetical protein